MKQRKIKRGNFKEAQEAHVKLLYLQGFSIQEIIEQTDMNYTQIERLLIKTNLKNKPKHFKLKEKEEVIASLFKKGITPEKIGSEVNLKTKGVKTILKKMGLMEYRKLYAGHYFDKQSDVDDYKNKLKLQIKEGRDSGKNARAIANELNVSVYIVSNYLKHI
ncbi:MAG: hypothetical protein ABIT08_12145 [Bacteroidia bacterium]